VADLQVGSVFFLSPRIPKCSLVLQASLFAEAVNELV